MDYRHCTCWIYAAASLSISRRISAFVKPTFWPMRQTSLITQRSATSGCTAEREKRPEQQRASTLSCRCNRSDSCSNCTTYVSMRAYIYMSCGGVRPALLLSMPEACMFPINLELLQCVTDLLLVAKGNENEATASHFQRDNLRRTSFCWTL